MWNYERRLQYPVNITRPNAKIAQIILTQYGGPDGEMGASMRYLSQRYSMPDRKVAGLLTDIGTEELAHLEMVASIVRQLTKGMSAENWSRRGLHLTMWITRQVSGRRQREAFRLMRASFSPRAMRSPICLKIWRRSRKRARPTTIFCVWSRIREVCDPIRFLRQREMSTSSASARDCGEFRTISTAVTFICVIPNLIRDAENKRNCRNKHIVLGFDK